jgi:hypothetical protein
MHAPDFWPKIVDQIEEKLQLGLLEQVRAVTEASFAGGELALVVASTEALEFFGAHVNQQRLIILARPVLTIDRVSVRYHEE